MPCDISLGRAEQCKDQMAGIQSVYFLNYSVSGAFTQNANEEITAFPSGSVAYRYDVKGAGNSYVETVNTSRDTGTTYFDQTLNVQLKRIDAASHKQFKLLAYGRPRIVVHTRNGDAIMLGLVNGADMSAGTISSGEAFGDLSGYQATFLAQEKNPGVFVSGSSLTDPFVGLTGAGKPSVVTGSVL